MTELIVIRYKPMLVCYHGLPKIEDTVEIREKGGRSSGTLQGAVDLHAPFLVDSIV
jgi:hypothetical protein